MWRGQVSFVVELSGRARLLGKMEKLPQTHFSRPWLCLLSQKSEGIMFLCYVKRIHGESYRQAFLRNRPEDFRGFKEVFCLHLECVRAARMIFQRHISDHITLALRIHPWLPFAFKKKVTHFVAWQRRPFMVSLQGCVSSLSAVCPHGHHVHSATRPEPP